ncbi:hypothetical protein [Nocardioides sp.]|uniref:hypothetical protein n=1 Tax=Nocardioides sp. TaxID=35761 RepID=UPI0035614529
MSEQGPGNEGHDEVGSVAEEATKLFGAMADWARDHGSDLGSGVAALIDQASASAQEVSAHIATDDPECRYCPICRTVHAVRQSSPEVRAQLTTAASSLLQAAAGLLASATESSTSPVEHIDLDEETDPDDLDPSNDRG